MRIVIPVEAPELDAVAAQLATGVQLLAAIQVRLTGIEGTIVATQAQVDAIAAAVDGFSTALSAAVTSLQESLTGLTVDVGTLAAEAAVDVGPLQARIDALNTAGQQIADAATGLAALDAENPPPPA